MRNENTNSPFYQHDLINERDRLKSRNEKLVEALKEAKLELQYALTNEKSRGICIVKINEALKDLGE